MAGTDLSPLSRSASVTSSQPEYYCPLFYRWGNRSQVTCPGLQLSSLSAEIGPSLCRAPSLILPNHAAGMSSRETWCVLWDKHLLKSKVGSLSGLLKSWWIWFADLTSESLCGTVPDLEPGLQGHDDGLRTGGISGTLSVAFKQASGSDIILYLLWWGLL